MGRELETRQSFAPAGNLSPDALQTMREANTGVGIGGGGENFLKVDKDHGTLTFGQEGTPLPPDRRRFVVPLTMIMHGYIVNVGGKPAERHLVPMCSQGARPTPPGGRYAPFPEDGPRDATEITLHSVQEPGFSLVFTAWGVSNANRLRRLVELSLNHADTPAGKEGFLHPVIEIKSGSYHSSKKGGLLHHFDFDLIDWLHNDGVTFASEGSGDGGKRPAAQADDPPPWEDDEEEEEMSEDERDLLRA